MPPKQWLLEAFGLAVLNKKGANLFSLCSHSGCSWKTPFNLTVKKCSIDSTDFVFVENSILSGHMS